MNRIYILAFLACFTSSVYAAGDAEAGKALTAICGACHGQDGNSPAPNFPHIAGQTSQYLLKQLKDMRSGARKATGMEGQLDSLSDTDLANIAAYYSAQSRTVGAAKADLVQQGETIYRVGVPRKKIAACTACHSPTGNGNGPAGFPALAGQWPQYTEQQLKAFRSGERHNDGDEEMMQGTSEDLSDGEIAAVASYIYGIQL